MKPIAAMSLDELRRKARDINNLVDSMREVEPCPGYKRACGTLTPRRLCFYCRKTKDLGRG